MPHTNRKKKGANVKEGKIVHTKRQQIEDEEGWTHVVDTPRKGKKLDPEKGGWQHAGDFEKNGVSYINKTLKEMGDDYDHYAKQWKTNEACALLRDKLASAEGNVTIENVVCLGLGSLQSARREGRRASHTQLAALRTIVEILAGEQKLQCIFQDPQFTDLDKEFITSLGYTVVEDPAAFGQVAENTLVYAIHCYADVYKIVSEGPRPAIMVGTDVENFGKFNLSEKADTICTNLKEMVNNCEEIEFPQIRHDFSDTKIYWRKVLAAAKE